MCFTKSVSFIELLMAYRINDEIFVTILIQDKKLQHFKFQITSNFMCWSPDRDTKSRVLSDVPDKLKVSTLAIGLIHKQRHH